MKRKYKCDECRNKCRLKSITIPIVCVIKFNDNFGIEANWKEVKK